MTSKEGKTMSECNFKCRLGLTGIEMGEFFERVKNIDKNTITIMKKLEKQNGRIGRLEKWRWKLVGIFIGISGAIGGFIKYLSLE